MDSYQYRVFKERYPFLQEGVKPEVVKVAHKLYSRKLISRATGEAATFNMWTPDQKSSELLKSLDTRIKTDPKSFYDFMAILRSIPSLRYLFRDLNERLPEQLQPEYLEDPPIEEEDRTNEGFPAIPVNQNVVPGSLVYIVQPLNHLPPAMVTGQIGFTIPPFALPVYNPKPPSAPSIDLNELTGHLPKHILNRSCEDVPLADIANGMFNYDTIYTYFGLTRVKMEDITRRYPHSPSRQRQELLYEWRDMVGSHHATYQSLINCFGQAKRSDLVNITCETIERHYHEACSESGDATLIASPEEEDDADNPERTAFQPPQRAPSEDPPPGIPFVKQRSQLQSPGTVTPPGDDMPRTPRILTTMPSSSFSFDDLHQPDSTTPSLAASHPHMNGSNFLPQPGSHSRSPASSEDSFHTARTHGSTHSIRDLSDGETTTDEELRKQLDRIVAKCTNRLSKKKKEVQDLKRKLKEKDEQIAKMEKESKELRELLANKEQELASRSSHPVQETQPFVTELEQELEITKEYTTTLECERDELASECVEAQSKLATYRSQNRGLHKEVRELRCKLVHSQQETHDCNKENMELSQRIKDLDSSIEFFLSNTKASCRRRSQSF